MTRKKTYRSLIVLSLMGALALFGCASEEDLLAEKRAAIEAEYPELKDFETQESFAGQSVKHEAERDEDYFAYIVHGSGLPFVEATCFQVGSDLKPVKVGEFPDPVDSFMGYEELDPKTCEGIKMEADSL